MNLDIKNDLKNHILTNIRNNQIDFATSFNNPSLAYDVKLFMLENHLKEIASLNQSLSLVDQYIGENNNQNSGSQQQGHSHKE